MLTEIQISVPSRSEVPILSLPVFGFNNRFQVSFIDGLDPVKAEASSSKLAIIDGEHWLGSRVGMRNIVLTLDLIPDYGSGEDPHSMRRELYWYLTPKQRIDLALSDHEGVVRRISGIVESFEAPLFAQNPAVQISILCPDPYFLADEETVIVQTVPNMSSLPVNNGGDVAIGVSIVGVLGSASSSLLIGTSNSYAEDGMEINYSFSASDHVEVNTNPRSRNARIATSGVSLIGRIASGSNWPRLNPGNNLITFRGSSGSGSNVLTVTYQERYVGL